MLGVISTHEPIRGEFAKSVREMLSKSNSNSTQRTTTAKKTNKWTIKEDL